MRIEYCFGTGTKLARECVVAIGFFDGVHIAHRELIKKARALADEESVPLAVLTFADGTGLKTGADRIFSESEKEKILDSLGVDYTVFCDFSSVRGLCADEFIEKVLIDDLSCIGAAVGYNFRFAKGALGTAEYLKSYLINKGRKCIICEEVDSEGKPVSSSVIRELISEGKIDEANRLLGSPYFISACVEHGDGRGRHLGYPTLNTNLKDGRCIPKRGVYRSAVIADERIYSAVTNIGTCPTFGERKCHAESFVIGLSENLYGKKIKLYLLEYLREERRFASEDELKMQIELDKNTVINKNGEEKWQEFGLSLPRLEN